MSIIDPYGAAKKAIDAYNAQMSRSSMASSQMPVAPSAPANTMYTNHPVVQVRNLEAEVERLRQQVASLTNQNEQLIHERDELKAKLAKRERRRNARVLSQENSET